MPARLTIKIVLGLVAAALLALVVFGGPALIQNLLSAKKEARIAKGQGKAMTKSAGEVGNTMSNVMAASEAIDETVEEGTDAIDKAEAGNSNDAADRAVCGMRSYRDSERCAALRGANPRVAAGEDAAGRPARKREAR
ncbi:MAG TPA: hypothetical protein VF605_11645 [Allosphingosinicella sp.]|jgi:hypothetical protein